MRLLQFLVHSDQPLELAAAVDIVAVRSDFRKFTTADRIRPGQIVRLCPNLLTIVEIYEYNGPDPEDCYQVQLHLAHLSVKEYLIQYSCPEFPLIGIDASISIVRTCLSYLTGVFPYDSASNLKAEFPFVTVAVFACMRHINAVEESPETVFAMADYLGTDYPSRLLGIPFPCSPPMLHSEDIRASSLHLACYLGLRATIKALILRGADVDCRNSEWYGMSPLEIASYLDQVESVQLLLDAGASPDTTGSEVHGSAFRISCQQGNRMIAKLLAEKGADINRLEGKDDMRKSPLQIAIANRDAELTQLLLDMGVDANADCGYYGTALQTAARSGFAEYVAILLQHGADVNSKVGACGDALQAAAEAGHKDTVQLLLDKGADANAPNETSYGRALQAAIQLNHLDVVNILPERGADVNAKGGVYEHALQAASAEGQDNTVKVLLDKGSDANAKGGFYGHALQAAVAEGHEDIVKLLLRRGADVNAQGGKFGNALYAAVSEGGQDIIELLMDAGANVNAQGGLYRSALTVACIRELPKTTDYLLDKGANANASFPGLGNALQMFMARRVPHWNPKSTSILKSLLEAGAEVQSQTGLNRNALQLAVQRAHLEPIKLLLSHGADANILYDASRAHFKHSLLIESLFKSQLDIAQELLQFGADPNAKTSRYLPGQTALHLAMDKDFQDVVRLLLQKGADANQLSGFPPFTPLQLSVKMGSVKYVRIFLEHGADVEALGGYNHSLTAIRMAQRAGNESIVQLLENSRAEKKIGKRRRGESWDTLAKNIPKRRR